jgi:hypothetical protein
LENEGSLSSEVSIVRVSDKMEIQKTVMGRTVVKVPKGDYEVHVYHNGRRTDTASCSFPTTYRVRK